MKLPQLAAVVASGDRERALARCRPNRRHQCRSNRGFINAVDHDLESRHGSLDEFARRTPHERRAEGIVGARSQGSIAGADLAARPDDAPRERRDRARNRSDRIDRPAGCRQSRFQRTALQDNVAAADPLADAHRLLDEKLAIHHRHPPDAAAFKELRLLEAVAKKADMLPERSPLLGVGEPIKHIHRRAGEQALRGAVGHRLGERLRGETEGEEAGSRPAIRRLRTVQESLHTDFGIAADDARPVAAGSLAGRPQPVGVVGRRDEPRKPQPKRLGKSVDNLCLAKLHDAAPLSAPICPARPTVRKRFPGRFCRVSFAVSCRIMTPQSMPHHGALLRPPCSSASCKERKQMAKTSCPTHRPRRAQLLGGVTSIAMLLCCPFATAADPQKSGIEVVPADAAFFSGSLLLKEQVEMVRTSNAMQAILDLPAVKMGLDQLEDMQSMPGSPLSMVSTFMELPENKQALDLLTDMVSRDTFIYGETSCIQFTKLLMALQRANQMASLSQAVDDELDDEDLGSEEAAARLFFDAVADNIDDLVLHDLVWGFQTTMGDAATQQLARLEVLLKLITQTQPMLADALTRETIDGSELIVFTLSGKLAPWDDLGLDAYSDDSEAVDKVVDKLRSLNLVIGLGLVGDRVVISIGDSIDHLSKLAAASAGTGLASIDAFTPYREAGEAKVTSIGYVSKEFVEILSPTGDDLRMLAKFAEPMAAKAELPEGAGEDARRGLEQMADEYEEMLPEPGAYMGYAFMTDTGFAGENWNWSSNVALDASQPLGILAHVGGSPFAVVASRTSVDALNLETLIGWGGMAKDYFEKYLIEKMDDDDREKFDEARETFEPLLKDLADTLVNKFATALADRQVALVLDDETKVERLQKELPSSADPLPVVEPAIVFGLADSELFKEGLNDLFALSDRLLAVIREKNPEAVPAGYSIPEPVEESVADGTVWSFPIPQAGLPEEIAPAIGLGKDVAVFSLVPGQAGRLLTAVDLKTASALGGFDRPLGAAAAADVPAMIDVLEAWLIYAARYASVQQREGTVDADVELSASDESPMIAPFFEQFQVVLDACRCLKAGVAEQTIESGVTITRWKNLIEDMPAR